MMGLLTGILQGLVLLTTHDAFGQLKQSGGL